MTIPTNGIYVLHFGGGLYNASDQLYDIRLVLEYYDGSSWVALDATQERFDPSSNSPPDGVILATLNNSYFGSNFTSGDKIRMQMNGTTASGTLTVYEIAFARLAHFSTTYMRGFRLA